MVKPLTKLAIGVAGAVVLVAFVSALTWLNRPLALPPKDRLVVSEWHVQIPTSKNLVGAYYTINQAGYLHLGTRELDNLSEGIAGCHANINQFYLERTTTKPATTINASGAAINGYYYARYHPTVPSCAAVVKNQTTAKRIGEIQTALAEAAAQITVAQ